MFIIILLLPLLTTLVIGSLGFFIGTAGSLVISCINLLWSWFLSLNFLFSASSQLNFYTNLWVWLEISNFQVYFNLKYDSLTAVIFIVVTTVSCVVHLYSTVYMYNDPFLSRFISYLSLFTFFILLLVSSGNILVLFIGWEGVGLCSYLLIGFWHTRAQAGKAATKAFLINKVGDLFLLAGISLLFLMFHSLDFSVLNVLIPFSSSSVIEVIAVCLFIGAVGKSAQIGLHTWLPDAMEGPTPVSALIHAATMVTAGVFLIIRCSVIFEQASKILYVVALIGGLTALISGSIGSVQNDIKKVIAYSTCSQLGYIVLACGLSLYDVGFFHLFNHAFFKALLFLSAGSVIHFLGGEQDIRKIGGLGVQIPFIHTAVLIGSLALAGFPFLAGFYSKDLIIESANTHYWLIGQALYWFSSIAAILTAYYSFRLIYIVFVGQYSGFKVASVGFDVTILEVTLLGFLTILSIYSGYCFKDIFNGFGTSYFNNSIFTFPVGWSFINLEFIPVSIKLFPLFGSLVSLYITIYFNSATCVNQYQLTQSSVTYFELSKWLYNEIINFYLSIYTIYISRHVFEQYEKRSLEFHGPLFITSSISRLISWVY